MGNREANEIGEIDRKRHLRDRQKRLERHVFARTPWLRFAFNSILRRARKIGLMIKDRLEHRSGVIERKTNAQREQTGQEKDFFHPAVRVQLALRANIKYRHRDGGSQKNRNVEEQGARPTLGSAGGRMQQHAQGGEKKISKIRR